MVFWRLLLIINCFFCFTAWPTEAGIDYSKTVDFFPISDYELTAPSVAPPEITKLGEDVLDIIEKLYDKSLSDNSQIEWDDFSKFYNSKNSANFYLSLNKFARNKQELCAANQNNQDQNSISPTVTWKGPFPSELIESVGVSYGPTQHRLLKLDLSAKESLAAEPAWLEIIEKKNGATKIKLYRIADVNVDSTSGISTVDTSIKANGGTLGSKIQIPSAPTTPGRELEIQDAPPNPSSNVYGEIDLPGIPIAKLAGQISKSDNLSQTDISAKIAPTSFMEVAITQKKIIDEVNSKISEGPEVVGSIIPSKIFSFEFGAGMMDTVVENMKDANADPQTTKYILGKTNIALGNTKLSVTSERATSENSEKYSTVAFRVESPLDFSGVEASAISEVKHNSFNNSTDTNLGITVPVDILRKKVQLKNSISHKTNDNSTTAWIIFKLPF